MKAEPVRALLFVPEERRAVMQILYLKTDIFDKEDLWNKGFSMISKDRREKIRNYKNEMTARLSLGAGVLLRIAMDKNGVSEEQIVIGEYGKPYISDAAFYFNLSHSGEYVFCAYDDLPIGIDIQKIKNEIPKHTDKILSEKEKQYLASLEEKDRMIAFYTIWADKESVIKWDGRGLRLPLQTISVASERKLISEINFEGNTLVIKRLDLLQPHYAISICSQKETAIEHQQEINENFLIKY